MITSVQHLYTYRLHWQPRDKEGGNRMEGPTLHIKPWSSLMTELSLISLVMVTESELGILERWYVYLITVWNNEFTVKNYQSAETFDPVEHFTQCYPHIVLIHASRSSICETDFENSNLKMWFLGNGIRNYSCISAVQRVFQSNCLQKSNKSDGLG